MRLRATLPSAWRREALRTNLWLVPTAEIVLAVGLFAGTYALDRAAYDNGWSLPSFLVSGSADTARQILTLALIKPGSHGEFVPHISVTVTLALVVLDVAVLVVFIDHIAKSIQLPQVIASIAGDLSRAIEAEVAPVVDAKQDRRCRRCSCDSTRTVRPCGPPAADTSSTSA